jgi:hypothetical protein
MVGADDLGYWNVYEGDAQVPHLARERVEGRRLHRFQGPERELDCSLLERLLLPCSQAEALASVADAIRTF